MKCPPCRNGEAILEKGPATARAPVVEATFCTGRLGLNRFSRPSFPLRPIKLTSTESSGSSFAVLCSGDHTRLGRRSLGGTEGIGQALSRPRFDERAPRNMDSDYKLQPCRGLNRHSLIESKTPTPAPKSRRVGGPPIVPTSGASQRHCPSLSACRPLAIPPTIWHVANGDRNDRGAYVTARTVKRRCRSGQRPTQRRGPDLLSAAARQNHSNHWLGIHRLASLGHRRDPAASTSVL